MRRSSRANSACRRWSAAKLPPRRCKTGQRVTVSCADGEIGHVYEGDVPFEVTRVSTLASSRCRGPQIMVNLGNPDLAFRTAMMPNAGVGLARMEFIISEHIGVHPMALVASREDHAPRSASASRRCARSFTSPREFFVREPGRGCRHDRRRFLSEAGDRPAVGLQDQRIRRADRRRGVRAAGGQPDAGLPRRVALRASGLCGGLRAGMRGAASRSRRHGADQSA